MRYRGVHAACRGKGTCLKKSHGHMWPSCRPRLPAKKEERNEIAPVFAETVDVCVVLW